LSDNIPKTKVAESAEVIKKVINKVIAIIEIKPPAHYKINDKNKDIKRVLKLKKEKETYLITWSFQYNS
jgi:hypothetical protein